MSSSRRPLYRKRRKKLKHFLTMGGNEVEISKIESVHSSGKKFIHFDEMDNGSWRLLYSNGTLSDKMVMNIVQEINL